MYYCDLQGQLCHAMPCRAMPGYARQPDCHLYPLWPSAYASLVLLLFFFFFYTSYYIHPSLSLSLSLLPPSDGTRPEQVRGVPPLIAT